VVRLRLAATAALLLLASPAQGAQGLRGRASLEGVRVEGGRVEGIEVRAYTQRPDGFGPLTGDAPAARTPTAPDGTWTLAVPPGRYVVEAVRKKPGNTGERPETGDLYCLFSGSPVTVAAEQWTAVGLYLVPVPAESRARGEGSRISGVLTFKGEPVERAYLYAYRTVAGDFRGPADLLQPVARGAFSVRLPPGTWYLVARKRKRGGSYGPVETGDLFNFYPGNPIVLAEKEEVRIAIPLMERLDLPEAEAGSYRGVRVRVVDAQGRPLAGHYVLAYPDAERTGHPAATSAPTDAAGETTISPPAGATHLRARATLGGPLAEGEAWADGELPARPEAPLVLRVGRPR
jgi:hypothetical protein